MALANLLMGTFAFAKDQLCPFSPRESLDSDLRQNGWKKVSKHLTCSETGLANSINSQERIIRQE